VTSEIVYITATQEEDMVIAPASTKVDDEGNIVEELIEVRCNGEIYLEQRSKANLIDISPLMVSGSAAALIPFLNMMMPIEL